MTAAIADEVVKCNAAIDKEAERLGFAKAKCNMVDFQEYRVDNMHSPEYWDADERLTKIRDAIDGISARLSLKVAMGTMTADELEKELDAVNFYEISQK